MRFGMVAASLVLVAGGAMGCGGDGDGGGDADDAPSVESFCGALKEFQDDFSETDPTADLEGYIKNLKEAADKLEDLGTPDDMPEDARDGFDLTIETIKGLADDATLEDLAEVGDVSEEDQKKIDALDEYIAEKCPELDGEDDAPDSTESP